MKKLEFKQIEIEENKKGNYRSDMLKKFLTRLNYHRKEAGFKPLAPARLGMLMSYIKTSELEYFYKHCNEATHFSKRFWYYVKGK